MLDGARFRGSMTGFGPEKRNQLASANRILAVGSELGIATLIGLFGGSWLDGRLGTRPWLTFLGLALGMAAGIKSLMRLAPKPRASAPKKNDDAPAPAKKSDPTLPPDAP